MAPSPPARWKVEYQTETIDFGADGKATQGMRVGIVVNDSIHTSFFVPRLNYSAAEVQKRGDKWALEVATAHMAGS